MKLRKAVSFFNNREQPNMQETHDMQFVHLLYDFGFGLKNITLLTDDDPPEWSLSQNEI